MPEVRPGAEVPSAAPGAVEPTIAVDASGDTHALAERSAAAAASGTPTRVGPYRIVRELGRGGMGVVYLAERDDAQYQKQVALKVMRGGFDREEIVRGFRRERQILASLEHPNVARFLDGGTTDDGLPYFVMEYVPGTPLDAWCNARQLDLPSRIRLFLQVCSAVAYAHRSLVVHRDLKPGNVLVGADGVPKLLDFGIAKLTATSGETATATALAMTPAYASPEQVRGEAVTTASDVYSLGVVLYELLTGQLPYRVASRDALSLVRAVCDEEPVRPSTVVKAAAGSPEPVARLRRRLSGDLDLILLTALQKEPQQRYASVEALAEDLRRQLDGRPILARKPTLAYRTRKFLTRHWPSVAAAAVVVASLAGFVGNALVQAERIARERDKAERVSAFLVDLFKVSDPDEARGNTVTAREILDRGAERIRGDLTEDPEVRAALMETMGRVYRSLGLFAPAESLLRESLDVRRARLGEHVDTTASLHALGTVLYQRGRYPEAETMLREALEMRRRLLGREHRLVASTLNSLAILSWEKGDLAEAEQLYRESLDMRRRLLGPEHPDVATSLGNLAIVQTDRGDYVQAAATLEESLALSRKAVGDEHPDVARTSHNLAVVLHAKGDIEGAEKLERAALEARRTLLGPDHPEVTDSLLTLGAILSERGAPGAEAAFREAEQIATRGLGAGHVVVALVHASFGDHLVRVGRLDEAEALYRGSLSSLRTAFPDGHPNLAAPMIGLATVALRRGEAAAAEASLRDARSLLEKSLPAEHPWLAETDSLIGASLAAQGRTAEARPLLERSWQRLRSARSDAAAQTREAKARLAALQGAGR